ncbi:AbrB family transcriptional regulator [Parabacteroides sp. PF5-9]|uniref:AbrB family transcriptional regulator n=1 Tax=Parabacteroides sp. PF5-9 TaxID=1742404 RepID=UPI0024738053|nr:AbrB family transcriptional regulator [Parabacteroides sp. PF5-9]MDH6357636.1 hypothetical protein [Parabacteroides sp. PF5-9]
MKLKKESPAGKQGQSQEQYKGNNSSRIQSTIQNLFSSGRKLTAKEINSITGSNDARKQISNLRREGWNITDMRLPDNRKLYWLISPSKQLSLFQGGSDI